MSETRCPRCEATQPSGTNFCTRCGYAIAQAPAEPAVEAAPAPEARFVACPSCGATNAASRRRCGRCAVDLTDHGGSSTPAAAPVEPAEDEIVWEEEPTGSPVVFIAAVTVAGLAILGVIVTILSASGLRLGPEPEATPEEDDVVLAVSSVRASSVLPPSDGEDHEPRNLIDGDPTTTWREAADGAGVGEWVELQLEGSPEVTRLLVWNGDQRQGRFSGNNRASQVRIELGDRTFTADLLDVEGPQAVELPEVVEASSVRLTIIEVVGSEEDGNVALSGIEVRGPPE